MEPDKNRDDTPSSAPAPDEGATTGEQYVTFRLGDELFAFPMAAVREIIRMPDVIRVPLAPAALEGVANLRSQVLPIVSLRKKLALAARAHDAATRVVVVDHGDVVGFIVDSVASVLTVEPEQRDVAAKLRGTVDASLLSAVLRGLPGDGIAMVLDASALVRAEAGTAATSQAALASAATAAASSGIAEIEDERQLVSFAIAGQEYAFDIERVQEIVQVPPSLTKVPNAPAHVLGVMTLRDRLVPLVSLREMFGLERGERTAQQRIVLTSVGADGNRDNDGGAVVGILMDSVSEVLRVPGSLVDAVPPFLRAQHEGEEVEAICRLESGKRLLSVLSVRKLFEHEAISDAIQARDSLRPPPGGTEMTTQSTDEATEHAHVEDDQLVVFQLDDVEYGVDIERVQEIIRLPDTITRVPNTHSSLAGIVNVRGEVLPIIDFRKRFELAAVKRDDRQRVIVLSIGGALTGFIVDSVSQVLKVSHAQLEGLPSLAGERGRAVSKIANLEKHKRMILVLDPSRIFDEAELASIASARGPGASSSGARLAA